MHIETDTVELSRRYPHEHAVARFVFVTGKAALDLAASIGADPQIRDFAGRISRPLIKVRASIAAGRVDLDSVVLPVAFRI